LKVKRGKRREERGERKEERCGSHHNFNEVKKDL